MVDEQKPATVSIDCPVCFETVSVIETHINNVECPHCKGRYPLGWARRLMCVRRHLCRSA